MSRHLFVMRATRLVAALSLIGLASQNSWAIHVPLQSASAQLSQGGFPVSAANDNIYSFADVGGAGWANNAGGNNIAVFETASDLNAAATTTLRFNLFAGGFGQHTVGRYRISYTTDNRATFADGLDNGGDVTANWIPLTPTAAISSGGATLSIVGNDILASGANPNRATDTVYATVKSAAPITGFRLETLEDPSFPANGPGRAANGNFVVREFDAAAFSGTKVNLANATAQASQGGFSVDNAIDGSFNLENAGGVGWADDVGGGAAGNTPPNVATFETVTDIGVGTTELNAEIFAGGFTTHTLGKFRISATTANRALFADGNDNGGPGVGNEPIWQVLKPVQLASDNPAAVLSLDPLTGIVLVSGVPTEYELLTLRFLTDLQGITGFRLETFEDATLPAGGPGRGPSNGNFVVREFSVFASPVPEPAGLLLLGLAGLALGKRRRHA